MLHCWRFWSRLSERGTDCPPVDPSFDAFIDGGAEAFLLFDGSQSGPDAELAAWRTRSSSRPTKPRRVRGMDAEPPAHPDPSVAVSMFLCKCIPRTFKFSATVFKRVSVMGKPAARYVSRASLSLAMASRSR